MELYGIRQYMATQVKPVRGISLLLLFMDNIKNIHYPLKLSFLNDISEFERTASKESCLSLFPFVRLLQCTHSLKSLE